MVLTQPETRTAQAQALNDKKHFSFIFGYATQTVAARQVWFCK